MAENNNIIEQEKVLLNIEENIFLDKEKIKKLLTNIIYTFDNQNENALTIGITGEWGSGKSSFLNILLSTFKDIGNSKFVINDNNVENNDFEKWIKAPLNNKKIIKMNEIDIADKKISEKDVYVINVNSWLISTIIKDPLFSLLNLISANLNIQLENITKTVINNIKKLVSSINIEFMGVLIDLGDFKNSYSSINELKENFNSELEKKIGKDGKVFLIIDDLDRIPPEEAVIMLDSIKLFLDNPKMVIFILNDKNVVKRGLKDKLKLEGKEEEDKIALSYLDKLINIEIDIEEYYNNNFSENIKKFIKGNTFIKDIGDDMVEKIINDKKVIEKLKNIGNMRRIKKIFKNFQIQAPSIVEYEDNEDKVTKYFEYFEKMLDKYSEKK